MQSPAAGAVMFAEHVGNFSSQMFMLLLSALVFSGGFSTWLSASIDTAALCPYLVIYVEVQCVFLPTADGCSGITQESVLDVGIAPVPHPFQEERFVCVLQVTHIPPQNFKTVSTFSGWHWCFSSPSCRPCCTQSAALHFPLSLCFPLSWDGAQQAQQFCLHSLSIPKCEMRFTGEQVQTLVTKIKAWRTWCFCCKPGNKQLWEQSVLDNWGF